MKKSILSLTLLFGLSILLIYSCRKDSDQTDDKKDIANLTSVLSNNEKFRDLVLDGMSRTYEAEVILKQTDLSKKSTQLFLDKIESARKVILRKKTVGNNVSLSGIFTAIPELKSLTKVEFVKIFKEASKRVKKEKGTLFASELNDPTDSIRYACVTACDQTYFNITSELNLEYDAVYLWDLERPLTACLAACPSDPLPDGGCTSACWATFHNAADALNASFDIQYNAALATWQACTNACYP